jgi:hypothetical protein
LQDSIRQRGRVIAGIDLSCIHMQLAEPWSRRNSESLSEANPNNSYVLLLQSSMH